MIDEDEVEVRRARLEIAEATARREAAREHPQAWWFERTGRTR